jgi:hypothetical protein
VLGSFKTAEEIDLQPVYFDAALGQDAPMPGVYPYRRGPYATMYTQVALLGEICVKMKPTHAHSHTHSLTHSLTHSHVRRNRGQCVSTLASVPPRRGIAFVCFERKSNSGLALAGVYSFCILC